MQAKCRRERAARRAMTLTCASACASVADAVHPGVDYNRTRRPLPRRFTDVTSSPTVPTRVIDSHTGGEPTRVVVSGGPDLGGGDMGARRDRFRERTTRGAGRSSTSRAARTCWSARCCARRSMPASTCGVIFFNNVGYIGMCGHGTIGLVATLAYLGRIEPGEHRIETPVGDRHGDAARRRHGDRRQRAVVPPRDAGRAWRSRVTVSCTATSRGAATGSSCAPTMACRSKRSRVGRADRVRVGACATRCGKQGVTGATAPRSTTSNCSGPPADPRNDARNFVLCPGGAYDRSPCGTGTSAKLACLAADGKLAPGAPWRQESVIGSVFTGRYARPRARFPDVPANAVLPLIHGRAHVTLDATLVFDPADAFAWGLRDASR